MICTLFHQISSSSILSIIVSLINLLFSNIFQIYIWIATPLQLEEHVYVNVKLFINKPVRKCYGCQTKEYAGFNPTYIPWCFSNFLRQVLTTGEVTMHTEPLG